MSSFLSWLWSPKSVRILAIGRLKAGKSTLINKVRDDYRHAETLTTTNKFQTYSCKIKGVPAELIDSPGFCSAEDPQTAETMKELNKQRFEDIDLIIFCCRLDQSLSAIDIEYDVIKVLAESLDCSVWKHTMFALTFADNVCQNLEQFGSLGEHVSAMGKKLRSYVSKAGVDPATASAIPCMPVPYSKDESMPGYINWYEAFLTVCIERMKEQPKTKQLKQTIAVPSAVLLSLREWFSTGSSASILLTGRTGAGKSSLINGMVGRQVTAEGHTLERCTSKVEKHIIKYKNVTITVWDSPGLQDGLNKEKDYIQDMQKQGCANTDLVLYCAKMNDTRLGQDESEAIRKLTKGLSGAFWENTVFVLTFANATTPPPSYDYVNLNKSEKLKTDTEYFNRRLKQWEEKLKGAVRDVGIDPDIVARIPVVAVGYETTQEIPGYCDNWLSNLWMTSVHRMKEGSQPALLIANKHRIKRPDQVKPEDLRKKLHEQPIVYMPVKYGAAPLVSTALGIIVGALVGGPVGAAIGGTAGAGAGSLVSVIAAGVSHRGDKNPKN